MDCIALKNFNYFPDGINKVSIEEGQRFALIDNLSKGFIAERTVEKFAPQHHGSYPDPNVITLVGSNYFPDIIPLSEDDEVPVGDLLIFAHLASRLTPEEWNEQTDHERTQRMAQALEAMIFLSQGTGEVVADEPNDEPKDEPVVEPPVEEPPAADPKEIIKALRLEFATLAGKPPGNAWVISTLEKKIAALKAAAKG